MAAAAERGSEAICRRRVWRAEAVMGAVIRSALARAGVDAAAATRLCLADEAAASLVAIPDAPELQRADGNGAAAPNTNDQAPVDALAPKILAQARGFADGQPPDFANASFDPRGRGEALTGGRIGQPLSRESLLRGADAVETAEGNMAGGVIASHPTTPRGLRPWHVRTLLAREPGDLVADHRPGPSGPHREGAWRPSR
jgi:hypothetical protein